MNHLVIAPILLPAVMAPVLLLSRAGLTVQRIATLAVSLALIVIALLLAQDGRITHYALGAWPAPFGIVLISDRLAATMLALTGVIALAASAHAALTGWDARGKFFYPLFLFQLFGINGAFLTGDAFNLFVFFEILLISSYGLIVHGGGGERLRAGVQYVVVNLAGSALFLLALGSIYAVTGTLNMADLGARAAAMPAADQALLRAAIAMLMIVFAIKAALIPFHFWLPASYDVAPGPAAAIFALLTKVGAYAILRMTWLVTEPAAATAGLVHWLVVPALLTILIGAAGMLATRRLGQLAAFGVVFSMGTLLASLGLARVEGIAPSLYYLLHSTLSAALVFLLIDLIRARSGDDIAPLGSGQNRLSLVFFIAAIAVTGLPPLSGFLGKLMILSVSPGHPWVWAAILGGSLIAILAYGRAGTTLFWVKSDVEAEEITPAQLLPVAGLVLALVLLTVFSGPIMVWLDMVAAQITSPADYIVTILGAS